MAKIKTKGQVRINVYEVISRAVEQGIDYGYNRAHKHTDAPDEHTMKHEMTNGVMNALCEVLLFNEDAED